MNQLLNNKIKSGLAFFETQNISYKKNKSVVISFLNPFSYYELASENELIEEVDYFFSDGSLLCYMHNLFMPKITRASFDYSSIAEPFFNYVQSHSKSIAIIGATTSENNQAVKVLKSQYPNMNVVFHCNGYIENLEKTLHEIDKVSPDVVLVGMGAPFQERFSVCLKNHLKRPALIITCGGFLTQTSIKPDYYHPLIKKLGLRWLQRIVMHKHVRSRVLNIYPRFIYKYLFSMVGAKFAKNK